MTRKNNFKRQVPIRIKRLTVSFTLIEVIVAVTVFGTAMVAVFGVLSVCSNASHHARMLTHAVLLAQSQLAELRLLDKPSFQITEGSKDLYKWQTQVVKTPNDEDLAAVKVVVTWNEQQREQRYELLSLMKLKSFSGQ
jgi:type II secretion system protein I